MFNNSEYWAETFIDLDVNEQQSLSIEFDDCTFTNCNFRESKFSHCRFINCHFIECDMNVVDFSASRFEETRFSRCKLTGIDWTKVDYAEFIQDAPFAFYESILNYSSFYGEKLENLNIQKCHLLETDFREADLRGADFGGSDLSDTLFRNTVLTDCDFREAYDYSIDVRVNSIAGAKFSRDEAVRLLEGLDIVLES